MGREARKRRRAGEVQFCRVGSRGITGGVVGEGATLEQFGRDGYAILRALIDQKKAQQLWKYVLARVESGDVRVDSAQVPGTPFVYADPAMERLLEWIRPTIEALTGRPLAPTYSHFRLYKHGDILRRHVDRPSCEISVSLNLGQEPDEPWALGICGRNGETHARLSVGDALLYRGTECAHWREPYQGTRLAQVFLHYVDTEGPNADWRFDRRQGLHFG